MKNSNQISKSQSFLDDPTKGSDAKDLFITAQSLDNHLQLVDEALKAFDKKTNEGQTLSPLEENAYRWNLQKKQDLLSRKEELFKVAREVQAYILANLLQTSELPK